MGDSWNRGTPSHHPSHGIILVLKDMVTWWIPQLRSPPCEAWYLWEVRRLQEVQGRSDILSTGSLDSWMMKYECIINIYIYIYLKNRTIMKS